MPILLYAEYDKSFVYIKVKDFGPGITDDVDRYLNQSLFVSDDYDYLYKFSYRVMSKRQVGQ